MSIKRKQLKQLKMDIENWDWNLDPTWMGTDSEESEGKILVVSTLLFEPFNGKIKAFVEHNGREAPIGIFDEAGALGLVKANQKLFK